MKVIFQDVDGCLNTRYSRSRCQGYTGIDLDKLLLLKEIVDATDAKIVLSSTWRLGYNKDGHHLKKHGDYLKKKFNQAGLEVFSVTPDLGRNGWTRGKEILTWLKDHPEVDKWVIIDDEDYDFYETKVTDHWIKTEYYSKNGGIQEEHVKKAIEMLSDK